MRSDKEVKTKKKIDSKKKLKTKPKTEIDFKVLDSLIEMQCTQEEIAKCLGVAINTIKARVKEKYNKEFDDFWEQKREIQKLSLRRVLWNQAQNNPSSAIFLSKNWLGYKDKQDITSDDKPLERPSIAITFPEIPADQQR